MRMAIVSDVHGNSTAFEAVLADLRLPAPDLIFHGGDLADGGANPAVIVDRIRDLGWPGVVGNADEMLFDPQSLDDFANSLPPMPGLFKAIRDIAAFSREVLGEERLSWLSRLPSAQFHETLSLVHAGPASTWRAPGHGADDQELKSIYGSLGRPLAVYGHVHHPYIRRLEGLTVANSGSVSLPYDGDRRASYLLIDDSVPAIRRVEYDIERELKALSASGIPHADWIARMLESAAPQMP
jgi:predicted phosphodiesterase